MKINISKLIKIIAINIVLIIGFLSVIEVYLAYEKYSEYRKYAKKEEISIITKLKEICYFAAFRFKYSTNTFYQAKFFRPPAGIEYKDKPSIILFGCSYAYGQNLKNEETLSYQLSEFLKQTVYNFGLLGGGLQDILHIIRNDKILNIFNIDTNNVQYVIYLYMFDHQRRLYVNVHPCEPEFKIKNGNFTEQKTNRFLLNSYITFAFKEKEFSLSDKNKNWDLVCEYIKAINKEIHKRFKNGNKETKFIVLVYIPPHGNEDWSMLENEEDLQIIKVEDLVSFPPFSKEYVTFDTLHPSALVWQLVVPKLAEELNYE